MQLPLTMSAELRLRAECNGGVWTRREALDLGHHDSDLQAWVAVGEAASACRGVYYALSGQASASSSPAERAAHATSEVRTRALAVLRVLPHDVVISHRTAVTVHGLPRLERFDADERIDVMPLGARAWSARPEVRMHRPIDGVRHGLRGGLRVISPADAVVQYAAAAGSEAGLVAADALLHRGLATTDQLAAAAARQQGRRGAGRVPVVVAQADGRSESPGESRTRLICVVAGIEVDPQVEIRDGSGRLVARVDLLVKGSRVVIEFDGLQKYRGEANANALVQEKRREHDLHVLGYTVVRLTWFDLRSPADVVRRIRAAMAGAR